jgi:hypothetical protein
VEEPIEETTTIVHIGVCPEDWARMYGYPYEPDYARQTAWLAVWYDPVSGPTWTNDGSTLVAGGNLEVYMLLVNKLRDRIQAGLAALTDELAHLGRASSDATHVLLIDLPCLDVYIGERQGLMRNFPKGSVKLT